MTAYDSTAFRRSPMKDSPRGISRLERLIVVRAIRGGLVNIIPILIIGPIARLRYKFNYFTIAGMIAGTYTDPPALAYANSICSKEAPALGYSTVYPLSMFLRIFTAQIIVLFFCG